MDNRTGNIYDMTEVHEEVDPNISLTPLTESEHKAMLQTPVNERASDLAWMRYKDRADLAELAPVDFFVDGFRIAREIYETTKTAVRKYPQETENTH